MSRQNTQLHVNTMQHNPKLILGFYGVVRSTRAGTSGWSNWICIEEASCQGRDGVEKAARFVRQQWERSEREALQD